MTVPGDCIVTSLFAEDGAVTGLRIERADERVVISDELVTDPSAPFVESAEGLFVIYGANGTARYALRGRSSVYPHAWDAQLLPTSDVQVPA